MAVALCAQGGNDRERNGLLGPVQVVRTEKLGSDTYDEAGNYRAREIFDDYGFPVGRQTFEYGNQRLLNGRPATAPVGPCLGAHRLVYRYVEGRVSDLSIFEEDGSLKRRSSYRYDARGNVAEETRAGGMGNDVFRYEYRYDDRGNWIRREETLRYDVNRTSESPPPLVRVTTRTITYF